MDNKILYGDIVKKAWLEEMKEELAKFKEENHIKCDPCLAVIQVGDNQASNKYINNKRKACEEVGIDFKLIRLEEDTTEIGLIGHIHLLNLDNKVDGIIVQLPLPKHIDAVRVGESINYKKDVDGFTSINVGKTLLNEDSMVSCTPLGIMKIFEHYGIELQGKRVCVVGRSNIVGKPMTSLLINAGATVISCNSHTVNPELEMVASDIVIVATGTPKKFGTKHFSSNTLIVDVGINVDDSGKLCGDVDKEAVLNYMHDMSIVPSPRGCGQTTVAALVYNTLKSYYNYFGDDKICPF